jgi:hypothetical protein
VTRASKHSPAARRIARELDKFRREIGRDAGGDVEFDQADQARIGLIMAAYDRITLLEQRISPELETPELVKLCGEVRLCEAQAARLVNEVQKGLEAAVAPPKSSAGSRNAAARKAASARWHGKAAR